MYAQTTYITLYIKLAMHDIMAGGQMAGALLLIDTYIQCLVAQKADA